jgi:hypothetical protein
MRWVLLWVGLTVGCGGEDACIQEAIDDRVLCEASCATTAGTCETTCGEDHQDCLDLCADSPCRQDCDDGRDLCLGTCTTAERGCRDACVRGEQSAIDAC